MDPEVIAQLEEQLRNLTDMLSQQNSMMANQMNAMKNGANGTANAFKNASQAVNQSATKYAEAQAKAAETSEKWSTAAKVSAGTLTALGTAAGAAAGVLGSLGGALLSAEKGFAKYGATASSAAQGAESLARAIPIVGGALGALVGTIGQIGAKLVTDALKLTDSITSLRDETVRTAGVLPTTSEGLLKLANDAKYYGDNIQILGKITQGLGTNLVGLGKNAGDGATKFMELANVTEETRQRFGKMGIDQQRLTELQAQYVKAQAASGLAYTMQNKSMETLRRESLKYVENMTTLSGLTGKQAEELQAEQDAARAVIQEKMAQRQDLIELQNLRQAGRKEEAAALEAKMKEKAEFRDRLVGLVGPEQAAQVMRVVRTGVYDNISGPLATLGLDFQQVSDALNSGADGIQTANKLGDQLTSAYNTQITNLGQAGLFLDEEQLKQLAINSETLGRQNLMFGKSYEEQDKLLKEMYEKRAGGSPMDDMIEQVRSIERQVQQRYQEFLINGIKKAAALLKQTDLMTLAQKAGAMAMTALKAGLVIAAGAVGVLTVAKIKEIQATRAARAAQKEFTAALRASTTAMQAQTRASQIATSADRQEAGASRKAASADIQEASASRRAASADLQEASASMKAASADLREAAASMRAAQADAREAAMGGGLGGKGGKGFLGKLGGGLKGGLGGLLGGLLLDTASEYAYSSGNEKLGAGLDVGSSALSGAGTGALIGSVIPGVGTVVGGAVGGLLGGLYGLWQNKDTLTGTPSPTDELGASNDAELQKQLDAINSISMPGNGQDILQSLSPEQLAAIGVTTGTQYKVSEGETLANIAEKHGISTEQLLAANPVIKKKDWKAGYQLNIPGMGLLGQDATTQPQMAFARPETEELIENAETMQSEQHQEQLGMLEEQKVSVDNLVQSNTGFSNSMEGASKSLRMLRDLVNELNKVIGGVDENGNPTTPGGATPGLSGGIQFGGDTDRILATIRQMESGNNYTAQNPTSSASGAYQFIDSTWQSLAKKYGIGTEFKSAKDAPPAIQDQVAQRYLSEILQQAGGDVSKVPVAWFTGNIAGKSSAVSQEQVAGYQSKWLGIYNQQPAGAQMAGMQSGMGGLIGNMGNLNQNIAGLNNQMMGGGNQNFALNMARMMVGMSESRNAKEIQQFLTAGGAGINPTVEAWCAAFVNSALQQAGIKGSGSAVANSFQNWGMPVPFGQVAPGDVVLETRNKPPGAVGGHVGLATGVYDGSKIGMIAGNTNNKVQDYMIPADGDVMVRRASMMPHAEKGGVFKGPDSGYLAMLHGKEAVIPLDNKFTRSQSSEQYTVNGKPATKREYDSFMKSHPELQNLQDKVKAMLGAVEGAKGDPTKMMNAVSSLMDTNLTGIKDEMVDKNKKIQDSLIQIVNTETNKAIKAVNESNLPMQTIANQMSSQMRKVMEAHTYSMNELAYKLGEMIDALNTSNDTTKKILKKASA